MEEDREFKHSCKFCNKRFPCGRSLGGHMRSHMINNTETTTTDGKFAKKKLPSVNNGGGATGETAACYSLRENPKKTRRLADTSDDTAVLYKGSLSSKTLFGSIERERVSNNTGSEDPDSWTSATQKLVMDSQSDNETAAPNRKRRSKRRRTRYMATANSSFSVVDSEIEQEQEEVAMCLMMLSRDMGPRVSLNSVAESSDNNSMFLEAKVINGGETETLKLKEKKSQLHYKLGVGSDAEFLKNSHKRSNFECTTCNKIFHSYQALGGHRASHKKIKGCFASKIDSNEEDSIETQLSPDPTPLKHNSIDHLAAADCDHHTSSSHGGPKKMHECPICLKVFSSGQALGGHKRSHLVNVTEARSNSTIVMEKPRNFLDLNLPAPAEEESNHGGHLGFKPWWIDSSHKHEALVGLISN